MTAFYGPDFGGPRAAALHQGRLVLVGSAVIPDLMVASRTGVQTDFRLTTQVGQEQIARPTDGFWFDQRTARNNPFHAVLQQEGMFLLGSQGESTIPAAPFTALTTEIRENSWYGSERGRTPVIAAGLVVFIQNGGKDVRGINWNELQRKYEAQSLLTLAGKVFERAVDMTFVPSEGQSADTVYVVDETGDVAVLTLSGGQIPIAWSQWNTEGGQVQAAAAPGGHLMLLVERDGRTSLEVLETDPGKQASDGTDDYEPQFDRECEILPFMAVSQTGTRQKVARCRIYRAVVEFVGPPTQPAMESLLEEVRLMVPEEREEIQGADGYIDSAPLDNTPDPSKALVWPVEYDSVSGWVRTGAIRVRAGRPIEIAGISYAASG